MNLIKQHPVSGLIISMFGLAKISRMTPWYLRQHAHLELGKILLEKHEGDKHIHNFVNRKMLFITGTTLLSNNKIIAGFLIGIAAMNLDKMFFKQ